MRGRMSARIVTAPTLVDARRIEALIKAAADGTPGDLLLAATRGITELLGERGSCVLLDGSPRVAVAPHAPAMAERPVDLDRYPEITAAAASGIPVAVEDARKDPRLEPVRHLLPPDLGSVVAVPLAIRDRCLGVVLVQSRAARAVSPGALTTAGLMARLTALLLDAREGVAVAPVSRRPAAANSTSGEPPATRPAARVLIVEDDAELSAIMAETLAEEGYLVEQARTGEEGLRRATAAPPGLVLLDVNLPVVDGFDMAERLRQAQATRDVPILFLSGTGDLATRVRSARLEEVDFLAKPYAQDELLTRVHRALEQAAARRRLRAEAEHDALTGLGNLRLLRRRMAAERARFDRYGMPLALVVVDVDKLKRINDQHGHRAGDRALRGVADVLRREVRETDLAVRTGGDEFVVLLPHTTLAEGMAFAHRTSAAIAELEPGGIPVTVSIGVASLASRGSAESDDDLLHRADSAAYRAKRRGGNQVCYDDAAGVPPPRLIDDAPRAD